MNTTQEWSAWKIEECCDILDNRRIPVNSEDREKRMGDIPYYGANGLQGYIDDFIFDEPLILIAEDGGRFDEFATIPIAYRIEGKSWVNNHAHVLRAKAGFSQDAIFYALEHKDVQPFIVGGTRAKLNQSALRSIIIKLPENKPEQSKIAEVLSKVDQAIEQTESLIAKQQRIKTGLMQDLLTRGIDEHGNLRSEETHEFKDSPMGRIPVEWKIADIESLLDDVDPPMRSGPFGSALLKEELVDTGVPLLGIDNVFPEQFVRDYKRFVSPAKAKQLYRYLVRPGDLMVTIMGTVGRCCVVPDDIGEALSSKHVWTISLNKLRYSPDVACFQINHSPWVLNHFAQDEQGGIMASIRSETLRSTRLPVPPPDEMRNIEDCLRSISDHLCDNETILIKLSRLKTALMQDLLTGKVRVTPLLETMEVGS
ncbi:MAG: restriction endonuclease subunit S [Desulfobacterium sp.]|nr:restriction endonuclease subunit S [Desulfobacterium sp.]